MSMVEVEQKIRKDIEVQIGSTIAKMDAAKQAFQHANNNVEELTIKVNEYTKKFDKLKI